MNLFQFLTPKSGVAFVEDVSTLRQGLEKMRFHGYTALPVIDRDGRYCGTVTEGDFLWDMIRRGEPDMKSQEKVLVRDILRDGWNPPIGIGATPEELLMKVRDQNFLPVIDDRGMFVGIVTRKNVIGFFADTYLKS